MTDMEIVGTERRKFFERPEEPRALRITPRDIELLRNIARLRLPLQRNLRRSMAEARRMCRARCWRFLRMVMSNGRLRRWRAGCSMKARVRPFMG